MAKLQISGAPSSFKKKRKERVYMQKQKLQKLKVLKTIKNHIEGKDDEKINTIIITILFNRMC